jgi:mono/diheme cytochrome c family protein
LSNKGSSPFVSAALGLVALAGLAGCRGTEIEDAIGKVSWFNNMRDQPAVEPFEEAARMPPEGVVAVGAGVPLAALPDDYRDVPNPVAASEASIERGKEQYDIFCSVCH